MSFQRLMEELLEKTNASRTTLRLDDTPGQVFPVKAEALAPDINSIAGDDTIPIRQTATFQLLDQSRDILLQEDLLATDHPPPPELIERYGARAQMLAPLERDGELFGIISVHYAPGPRKWSNRDVAALRGAADRARGMLEGQ